MAVLSLAGIVGAGMDSAAEHRDDDAHGHQRRVTEATLAVLTATYHGLTDEAEAVLADLDVDDARQVIRALAAFAAAMVMNGEAIARVPHGAGLPRIVAMLSKSRPWLFG